MTTTTLRKGQRVTGAERVKLAKRYATAYNKGKAIREIAESEGRSYGFVHRVLAESSEVTLRKRGGANRRIAERRKH
jgi:transposase